MDLEELDVAVHNGSVDTVLLALTDMQGRLQGKRLHGRYFLDEVASGGSEGCNYLLAVDVDLETVDGQAVHASPRQILKRQLERLERHGLTAYAGTELEFILFRDTYEEAFDKGYRGLVPANQYNVDYSLLGTARVEPLLRRI